MNKKIYVWTLGNDERPATDKDIKDAENFLTEKMPDYQHVVYNHTLDLAAVIDEDQLVYVKGQISY